VALAHFAIFCEKCQFCYRAVGAKPIHRPLVLRTAGRPPHVGGVQRGQVTAEPVDPFVGRVIGKLTVLRRERRGGRWAYVCECQCGQVTPPMRAPYIVRRGAAAGCYNCSNGLPKSGLPVRSGTPQLRGERGGGPSEELDDGDSSCESADDPIWHIRAQLVELLVMMRALPTAAVIALAQHHFGWSPGKTREVLAAAEGHELSKSFGLWSVTGATSLTSVTSVIASRGAGR
jgi:hypothetical protein